MARDRVRLQIQILPKEGDPPTQKFVEFCPESFTLDQLCQKIRDRYGAMYPALKPLEINKLVDSIDYDLDPDFLVRDVCENGEVVKVVQTGAQESKYKPRNSNILGNLETPPADLPIANEPAHRKNKLGDLQAKSASTANQKASHKKTHIPHKIPKNPRPESRQIKLPRKRVKRQAQAPLSPSEETTSNHESDTFALKTVEIVPESPGNASSNATQAPKSALLPPITTPAKTNSIPEKAAVPPNNASSSATKAPKSAVLLPRITTPAKTSSMLENVAVSNPSPPSKTSCESPVNTSHPTTITKRLPSSIASPSTTTGVLLRKPRGSQLKEPIISDKPTDNAPRKSADPIYAIPLSEPQNGLASSASVAVVSGEKHPSTATSPPPAKRATRNGTNPRKSLPLTTPDRATISDVKQSFKGSDQEPAVAASQPTPSRTSRNNRSSKKSTLEEPKSMEPKMTALEVQISSQASVEATKDPTAPLYNTKITRSVSFAEPSELPASAQRLRSSAARPASSAIKSRPKFKKESVILPPGISQEDFESIIAKSRKPLSPDTATPELLQTTQDPAKDTSDKIQTKLNATRRKRVAESDQISQQLDSKPIDSHHVSKRVKIWPGSNDPYEVQSPTRLQTRRVPLSPLVHTKSTRKLSGEKPVSPPEQIIVSSDSEGQSSYYSDDEEERRVKGAIPIVTETIEPKTAPDTDKARPTSSWAFPKLSEMKDSPKYKNTANPQSSSITKKKNIPNADEESDEESEESNDEQGGCSIA
ncbi:MAG: hypothetical protein M1829_002615 [Trizodia sp. TS-e1964]|nr:MAG: hypothetical protein M1829_002615 [Trizodia sp. TS-e1964]